jgi:hypothetical protein
MATLSKRHVLAVRARTAHLIGLSVVDFYGTIGTSGGFRNGAWAGMLAGGIISIPWFAALLLVVWFFAQFYWDHIVWMCVSGPFIVCRSWWLLDGPELLDAIALSSVTSSLSFLVMVLWELRKRSFT